MHAFMHNPSMPHRLRPAAPRQRRPEWASPRRVNRRIYGKAEREGERQHEKSVCGERQPQEGCVSRVGFRGSAHKGERWLKPIYYRHSVSDRIQMTLKRVSMRRIVNRKEAVSIAEKIASKYVWNITRSVQYVYGLGRNDFYWKGRVCRLDPVDWVLLENEARSNKAQFCTLDNSPEVKAITRGWRMVYEAEDDSRQIRKLINQIKEEIKHGKDSNHRATA